MDKLEQLKRNILEDRIKAFTDEELLYHLHNNNDNVESASYDCLIIKAETTGLNVSGITTKDSSSYFKMLASKYVKTNSGVLK